MGIGEQKACIHWEIAYDNRWIELGVPLRKQGSYSSHSTLNERGLDVIQLTGCLQSTQ